MNRALGSRSTEKELLTSFLVMLSADCENELLT